MVLYKHARRASTLHTAGSGSWGHNQQCTKRCKSTRKKCKYVLCSGSQEGTSGKELYEKNHSVTSWYNLTCNTECSSDSQTTGRTLNYMGVQWHAAERVPSFWSQLDAEWLKRHNLCTLEEKERRMRGTLIQVFKYMNKCRDLDHSKLFALQLTQSLQTAIECSVAIGTGYFSNRIIYHRKKLTAAVINVETIKYFKNPSDRHIVRSGVNWTSQNLRTSALIWPTSHWNVWRTEYITEAGSFVMRQ